MKAAGRNGLHGQPGGILLWLALVCAAGMGLAAQATPPAGKPANAPSGAPATAAASTPASAQPAPSTAVHAVITLDGPWRFQIGDDPRWADPGFDDSSWPTVALDQPLSDQGIDTYSGYAWYRLRLQPQQLEQLGKLPDNATLDMLVMSNSIGQLGVYVDGLDAGHSRGMTEKPSMYQSPPFVAHFSRQSASGPAVLAIRSWAGPNIPIHRGLLEKVELGDREDIAGKLEMAIGRQWNENVTAALFVTFLFLGVAGLGAALYLSQKHHTEYLWMALLCLSVTAGGVADALYGLALISLPVHEFFAMWTGRIFMAVTLEFVLRFTGSSSRRAVRIVQIFALLLPLISLLPFQQVYQALSIACEVVFCGLVTWMLYRGWRRGNRDAGVMLVPFFLASTADSIDTILDWAAGKHWLPEQFASHRFHFGPIEFGTGTVTYTVFLTSMIAIILYRFLRVSEDEQRSAAEIAAARSVQALLIPTQLPSNKNFMLDSAYFPVNGVGGDFFQVLPLKDDSLLIVVGDVSGKGLQAAMNASTLVGALRNELAHDPATVLGHLNHVLLGAAPTPSKLPGLDTAPCFATCLCARIYPDGTMTIANAGHLSPYRDGREMELAPGLPLGVIADVSYEQATYHLNRGERLIFLSDGVVEATNAHGELFGFERTQQVSNEPARYIAQTAQRFGQNDDITVVSVYVSSRTAHRPNEAAVAAG